ncbi:MAG: TRAP transporter substrate-binding protein [Synergistaceae bacterium]|nr:TRAP transporter substrate-binding protein [Synergistaceae bacterium]MBQ3449757.1 TRAP transporter substrate-binding protein [Synergistaceae bacterium]MBQ3693283.1 TRAP transporter substrate-binding protein [Synergistaceae bacterium]MBQ6112193.1 TRAP transporter substrate-binding protein [Synergistaceae bacterium]MBQ9629177.1 TRAP transporter substrate-binding protein [Synergistaceae bacterium]
MKKIITALLVCVLFSSCAFAASEFDEVWLVTADTTAKGAAGQVFAQLVQAKVKAANSGLVIDYFPNGELGGDADLIRQAQKGYIAITVCQTAPIVSFIPEMAVFDLPMVFARYDGDTIDKVLNGDSDFHKQMAAAYNKAGLHLLGFMQNATYRLATANKNLLTLTDFNGLQIRTMENKNHMDFWTAIGAEPTPLAWSELYISLQNGTVNAQENAADTCVGAHFEEVQKYLACTNHILYCNQICMNEKMYQALSPEHKAVLDKAVSEALQEMRPRLEEIDKSNKAILEKGGMTIINYDNSFFSDVLAIQGVKDLYKRIDSATNGLASTLEKSLADVAAANAPAPATPAAPAAEPAPAE